MQPVKSEQGLSTNRNHALDGLRGYAALSVAIFHTITALDYSMVPRIEWQTFWTIEPSTYNYLSKIVLMLFNGESPVVIFFVLSGLVLFDSLRRSKRAFPATATAFLIRRAVRIYPAMFACLIVAWLVLDPTFRDITVQQFIENAALVSFQVNGATWTLQVELLAAPLVVMLFFAFRLGKEAGLIIAAAAFFILLKAIPIPAALIGFAFHWPSFALGMLIPTRAGQFLLSRLPHWAWVVAFGAMISVKHLLPNEFYPQYVQSLASAALVGLIYYGRTGKLGAFLSTRFSIFLGLISYSFYLHHAWIMESITKYAMRASTWPSQSPVEAGLLLSVLVIGVSIFVAVVSYRLVEAPSLKIGYWLTTSQKKVNQSVGVSAS